MGAGKKAGQKGTRGFRVIGLTGGVAVGKSTVARLFEEEGIPVVDADQVARELSAPGGRAHDALVARFGTSDRLKLREIVFNDARARGDLEALMHPLIAEESERRLAEAARATGAPVVLYEAALLVETGRYRDLDGLIVVVAPEEERRARLVARDRIPDALAGKMIASQMGDLERRAAADWVLENHGDVEELRAAVKGLAGELRRGS